MNLQKVFAANEAYQTNNFQEAVTIWPNFPSAHSNNYEMGRKQYHEFGFDWIYTNLLERAIRECPNEADMHRYAADVCMRYEHYEKALEHLRIKNTMQPNSTDTWQMFGTIFREMAKRSKDQETQVKFLNEAKNATNILKQISSQTYQEAMNWIMLDNSRIPTAFEVQ